MRTARLVRVCLRQRKTSCLALFPLISLSLTQLTVAYCIIGQVSWQYRCNCRCGHQARCQVTRRQTTSNRTSRAGEWALTSLPSSSTRQERYDLPPDILSILTDFLSSILMSWLEFWIIFCLFLWRCISGKFCPAAAYGLHCCWILLSYLLYQCRFVNLINE